MLILLLDAGPFTEIEKQKILLLHNQIQAFIDYFYCISSYFSDLADMTDQYIDLSVYSYSRWFVVTRIVFNIYTKVKCMKSE